MELIPILSTIILVATISTFILAVGAYILYKVQEKRADQFDREEIEQMNAELVEPADFGGRTLTINKPEQKPVFVQHHYHPVEPDMTQTKSDRKHQEKERKRIKRQPTESKFLKFTSEGYVRTQDDRNTGVISWQ